MRKLILSLCIVAAGLILFAQRAQAGTQVYVSLGFPVVQYDMCGCGSCGNEIWIEGHYCYEHPRHVWVPGYWVPAWHDHAICIQRPPVYHRFHCCPPQGSCHRAPQKYHGSSRGGGHDEGYSHRQDNPQPQDNGRGQRSYSGNGRGNSERQPDSHQGQYNSHGQKGHRPDGNWMNNINNRVIKRQIHQAKND